MGLVMKFSVTNKWKNRGVSIRDVLFALLMLAVFYALKSFGSIRADEALLLSSILGILPLYWIPPIPKERYDRWLFTRIVVFSGVYLFGLKVPWLVSGLVNFRLAS